jgi:hypothetical protein
MAGMCGQSGQCGASDILFATGDINIGRRLKSRADSAYFRKSKSGIVGFVHTTESSIDVSNIIFYWR